MTSAKSENYYLPALRTEVYSTYHGTYMPTNPCQCLVRRQGGNSTFIIKIVSTELRHSFTSIQCRRLRKAGAISPYGGPDSWWALMTILRAPRA